MPDFETDIVLLVLLEDLPDEPLSGPIQVIIPGWEDDQLCQFGSCATCGAEIHSNCKRIWCPRCGEAVYLT